MILTIRNPTPIEQLQAIADAVEVTPEVAEHLNHSLKKHEAEFEKEVQAVRVTNEALGRGYSFCVTLDDLK